MKKFRLHLVIIALFSWSAITVNAAQPASAKVISVNGTVSFYTESAVEIPLTAGTILSQGGSVVTASLSNATLLFSNGSELTIEENTSITLAALTEEVFVGNKSYGQLQAAPGKSQTLIELNYGVVNGDVKRLFAGSEFNIETPLGTAVVYGNKFSVETRHKIERGEFITIVHNKDGKVDIISRYMGSFDYRRTSIAEKSFDINAPHNTSESIPPAHMVVIRLSELDPHYAGIVDARKNHSPFQNSTQLDFIISPPGPVVTPEDQEVTIISPNTNI